MKILFVIQGEGRGHLTQALSLRQKLADEGHEIVGVLVGKSPARRLPGFFSEKIGGLVCDPIGGLVENPCQNRNAMGASNALISAELSMAGIKSITPIDETIGVMYAVGRSIPSELRETSMGGMAVAKSACEACAACAKETQK